LLDHAKGWELTKNQFNLIRCAAGAVSVGIIQTLNRHLGAGWSFVLLSGIWLLLTPLPLIVAKYGSKWRLRQIEKDTQKKEESEIVTPALPTSRGPPQRSSSFE
jgi:hypothetical protein